jgi:group I intron endonuclease
VIRKTSLIHKAILKYGYSSFKLEILEYCDKKDLLNREQYYMDTLKPEYNILKVAGSPLGYKHSTEALEKIRTSSIGRNIGRTHSESVKNNIKAVLRTEEVRLKMVNAFLKRTGVKVSDETKAKMKLAQQNRD